MKKNGKKVEKAALTEALREFMTGIEADLIKSLYEDAMHAETPAARTAAKKLLWERLEGAVPRSIVHSLQTVDEGITLHHNRPSKPKRLGPVEVPFKVVDDDGNETEMSYKRGARGKEADDEVEGTVRVTDRGGDSGGEGREDPGPGSPQGEGAA